MTTTSANQQAESIMEAKHTPTRVTRVSGRKGKRRGIGKGGFTAETADIHVLYQLSVQNVVAEIDFVDETFETLRGRKATSLREDFCGTGATASEWVKRRDTNTAIGLDLDQPTLDWGMKHNIAPLTPDQQKRITLLNRDVTKPGDASGVDIVLAMNFSYWILQRREQLRDYFRSVRDSLSDDGVFFLDFYGGYEAFQEMTEDREIDEPDAQFTYVWDQHRYDPMSGRMQCYIHFKFLDGTQIKRAFSYEWRLWTLPEIRELLDEAGFSNVTVYWEGADEDGEGNGEFEPVTEGEADPSFICYIAAQK